MPCEDPPEEEDILRALPTLIGIPSFLPRYRKDVQIVTELLDDHLDPPFFALLGLARRQHCHWKCTAYHDRVIEMSWPFPFRWVRPCVDVLDMDMGYLKPGAGVGK